MLIGSTLNKFVNFHKPQSKTEQIFPHVFLYLEAEDGGVEVNEVAADPEHAFGSLPLLLCRRVLHHPLTSHQHLPEVDNDPSLQHTSSE